MSSECVELWVRIGADGLRGSLRHVGMIFDVYSLRRTHQYKISASSPCKSVPAATVKPSAETSKQSNGRGFSGKVTTLNLSCRNFMDIERDLSTYSWC